MKLSTGPAIARATRASSRAAAALLSLLAMSAIYALLAAAQNSTSLPAAWAHWKYSRTINLSETLAQRLVSVPVPQEVYGHSENHLADLRVTDDTGMEVPFVLEVPRGSQNTAERACRIQESSFVPGKYTQVVCDAGENTHFHNAITIQTPAQNFMAWAEVDVSDDAREWRIVNDRSPIYSFANRNLNGVDKLSYGDTNARYIRLRILLSDTKFPVASVAVLHQVSQQKESVPVAVPLTPESLHVSGESIWRADFGNSPLPVDEVRIETTQLEFSRRIFVQASNDGDNWYTSGGGDIYRFQQGDTQKESLHVSLFDQWTPYLRVHIMNGNDPPLENTRVVLYMTPREVVFRQAPGRRYLLLYGQSEAKSPQYDLAQTLNAEQLPAAVAAEIVGAEEFNSSWSDPRPWTDRHTAVLWIAAILAALLLAFVALRSLRSASPPAA